MNEILKNYKKNSRLEPTNPCSAKLTLHIRTHWAASTFVWKTYTLPVFKIITNRWTV